MLWKKPTDEQALSRLLAASAWLVIVLLAGLLPACRAETGQGPGRIELSATEFDLGTIPNTEPVSHTFEIRNVGEGRLEITGISTSCGCTTAEVADRSLAPGEATELVVTFDPQVHDGETGTFLRQVYLRSNDPETPEAVLTLHVTVVEAQDAGPSGGGVLADVAALYQEFLCPCCGQDIGSCTCGLAAERRATVDHVLQYGGTPDRVYQAMFQIYGAGVFADPRRAEETRSALLATLPADRPILVAEPASLDLGQISIDGGTVTVTASRTRRIGRRRWSQARKPG